MFPYSCIFLLRKGELGFHGFVQSDWWAVHEPSFVQGLDQEMPGQAPELFLSPSNTSQHPERVDEAATRILAAMYKVNLHETGMVAGHVFFFPSTLSNIYFNLYQYIYINPPVGLLMFDCVIWEYTGYYIYTQLVQPLCFQTLYYIYIYIYIA